MEKYDELCGDDEKEEMESLRNLCAINLKSQKFLGRKKFKVLKVKKNVTLNSLEFNKSIDGDFMGMTTTHVNHLLQKKLTN